MGESYDVTIFGPDDPPARVPAMIRFRVNGTPAPQGSKRHVGNGRMVESSRAVEPWREAVRAEAQRAAASDSDWEVCSKCGHHRGAHFREGCDADLGGSCPCRLPYERGPLTAPVSVTATFVLRRPQTHYSVAKGRRGTIKDSAPHFPAGRPDVDKLARAVLDGLVMGGVMADDAQVVSLTAAKVYVSDGQAPGVLIEVEAMS